MNIDLLFTKDGEPGLICDEPFDHPAMAVLFDMSERVMSVEFEEMDSRQLNIPVEDDFANALYYSERIQLGVILEGKIAGTLQLPLILLEEGELLTTGKMARPQSSIVSFERFVRTCETGQPVHRDELGNEATLGSVMDATVMVAPQFAPQLARQRALEAGPKTPGMSPRAPGPLGPGGLGGGAGGGTVRRPPQRPQSTGESDNETD